MLNYVPVSMLLSFVVLSEANLQTVDVSITRGWEILLPENELTLNKKSDVALTFKRNVRQVDPTPTISATMPDGTGCPANSELVQDGGPATNNEQLDAKVYTCECNYNYACEPTSEGSNTYPCQYMDTAGVVMNSSTKFACIGSSPETCWASFSRCVVSTKAPSMAPTHSPLECPINCGDGTCDEQDQCTSCGTSTKLLAKGVDQGVYYGRCVDRLWCRQYRVLSGGLKGKKCNCIDKNCYYCKRTLDGDECRKCRNGYYLLNGTCVKSCPSDYTSMGISLWGRKCMEPFTCKGGRSMGTEEVFGCRCVTMANKGAHCYQCSFNSGEYGQTCTRCNGGKYLIPNTNQCEDDCSSLNATNIVSYKVGNYGALCRSPFTCQNQTIVEMNGDIVNYKCSCPNVVGGSKCTSCDWLIDGTKCTTCVSGYTLIDGICQKD